jgi:hypothetical protein
MKNQPSKVYPRSGFTRSQNLRRGSRNLEDVGHPAVSATGEATNGLKAGEVNFIIPA